MAIKNRGISLLYMVIPPLLLSLILTFIAFSDVANQLAIKGPAPKDKIICAAETFREKIGINGHFKDPKIFNCEDIDLSNHAAHFGLMEELNQVKKDYQLKEYEVRLINEKDGSKASIYISKDIKIVGFRLPSSFYEEIFKNRIKNKDITPEDLQSEIDLIGIDIKGYEFESKENEELDSGEIKTIFLFKSKEILNGSRLVINFEVVDGKIINMDRYSITPDDSRAYIKYCITLANSAHYLLYIFALFSHLILILFLIIGLAKCGKKHSLKNVITIFISSLAIGYLTYYSYRYYSLSFGYFLFLDIKFLKFSNELYFLYFFCSYFFVFLMSCYSLSIFTYEGSPDLLNSFFNHKNLIRGFFGGFISMLLGGMVLLLMEFFQGILYKTPGIYALFFESEETKTFLFYLALLVIPPVLEELIFRFIPLSFGELLERKLKWKIITYIFFVIQAFFFAIAHFGFLMKPIYPSLIHKIFSAFLSGYIYLKYGLVASIIAHLFNNLLLLSLTFQLKSPLILLNISLLALFIISLISYLGRKKIVYKNI